MVRALRTGIMLLTLLLVVVGGTGMVSVCPCHEEIFIFSCSCHQDAAPCECHGDDVPRTGSSSPLAGHLFLFLMHLCPSLTSSGRHCRISTIWPGLFF